MKENAEMILENIITRTLNVRKNEVKNLSFEECEEWDSVSHMSLIAQLEEAFESKVEGDKILELLSYKKIKEWMEEVTEA